MTSPSFTHHALERYHSRWCATETREAASEALADLIARARPMSARSPLGDELWSADGIVLVVKRDTGAPVIVTVLPPRAYTRENAAVSLAAALLALDTTARSAAE